MLEQLRGICPLSLLIISSAIFIAILILRNTIIRKIHQDNFPKDLEFADTQLVFTPSQPLRRTMLLGSALFVPQGVNAVVARISIGTRRLFGPGDYIITDLRAAILFYKYVDITLRHLRILVDDAPTKDGFNISIWMNLSFRVTDAEEVANIDDPVMELIMLVEDSVRATTLRFNHDALVPRPEVLPVSSAELMNWIRDELIARSTPSNEGTTDDIQIVNGIIIRSIVIHSRIEDPNRDDFPKGPSEAEQVVLEAENRKEVAAIEDETRLQHAKTLLEEDEILIPVRERELDWEQRRAKPRLDIERERVRVQAQMNALIPALKIFVQLLNSQSYSRVIYTRSLDQLYRMFEEIFVSVWWDSDIFNQRLGCPRNARAKIVYQLIDLWTIEGYIEHRLREFDDGSLGLMVFIHKKQALFIFDVSGNDPHITGIILRSSSGRDCVVPNPGIYNSFSLAEAIKKLNERYHPGRDKTRHKDDCAPWD